MYSFLNSVETCKSYATVETARAAVDRHFIGNDIGRFNVQIVYNSKGRVVPLICNISKEMMHLVITCPFLTIN